MALKGKFLNKIKLIDKLPQRNGILFWSAENRVRMQPPEEKKQDKNEDPYSKKLRKSEEV